MPGAHDRRLPVVRRSTEKYEELLIDAAYNYEAFESLGDERVFGDKPGLKVNRATPLGLIFRC
jgi:hypothetical protein